MIGELGERIATLVRSNMLEIPDFPEPGVLFRDITELFANGPAFKELVELIGARYAGRIDAVAGLESRGFILGAPVAAELGLGMLTIRKAGKLPGHVIGVDYELEYGTARMDSASSSSTTCSQRAAPRTRRSSCCVSAVPPSRPWPFSSNLMRWVDARC